MKDPFENGFLGEVAPEIQDAMKREDFLKNENRIDETIEKLIKSQGE